MRRTIENGFELTGPIARGDWATVEAHLAAIRAARPSSSRSTARSPTRRRRRAVKIVAHDRGAPRRRSPATRRRAIGLVPTMGALPRRPRLAVRAPPAPSATSSSSASSSTRRSSAPPRTSPRYPRDEARDLAHRRGGRRRSLFAPSVEEIYPPGFQTWVDVEGARLGLEGALRPGHFRGVATVCLSSSTSSGPTRAYFGQKDAQQVAVSSRWSRDLNLELEIRVLPDRARRRRPRPVVTQRLLSPEERASAALALPRGARDEGSRRGRASCSTASSRLRRGRRLRAAASSPPRCASARPA